MSNFSSHALRSHSNLARLMLLAPVLILLLAGFFTVAPRANAVPAITINVNSTNDNNTADSVLTLREAILIVNGGTGGNGVRTGLGRPLSSGESGQIVGGVIGSTGVAANIVFTDLPGLSTINLTLATGTANESLPPILTSGVVVDGKDGAGGRVAIDGSSAPAGTNILSLGFATSTLDAIPVSDITIRSLAISFAKGYGIQLNPARNSRIASCVVARGTGPTPTGYAIFIQGKWGASDNNIIEDSTIGLNASLGIVLNRPGANNNIIRNNLIGTDSAGMTAKPNTGAGIALFTGTHDNQITGNVISGNTLQGIYFDGSAVSVTNNSVYGNKIGTAADGTTPLPNVQGIVFDQGSIDNTIGGIGAGQANIIAFNTQSGIVVVGDSTFGNRFSGNSIFGNGILGIDLLDDKLPTAGVSGGSFGPNRLALRPTLTKAQAFGTFGVIAGTASPNSTIEVYAADPSPSGFGSGKTYLATMTANASGGFSFTGTLAAAPSIGSSLTALSTLSDGSTSEFGNNLAVSLPPLVFLPTVQKDAIQ